ncbi:hypothetical protein [Conexibacter sp. SYSU D00693]|uniref:hypothetical protein n=1 Tax=Conexibacter sp. SYSU D00693 TaxID=2812560 RepID=UPI00196A3CC2|nr:hypothetical protein [Conexibacter sp. SYSU D00693]
MTEPTVTPEELERTLQADLRRLGDRLVDADFAGQLYRGLAGRTWHRSAHADGTHVALSWKRAEEVVNALRAERGEDPLELAQTGGESFLSQAVAHELASLGWASKELNTSRHDDAHRDSPPDEPRTAPDEERFARAHEEADATRRSEVLGGGR